jgi:hypothetical protein
VSDVSLFGNISFVNYRIKVGLNMMCEFWFVGAAMSGLSSGLLAYLLYKYENTKK